MTSAANRCQNTTAAAAVTRLLRRCPGEPDARAALGSSRIPFCISAKFVMAGMRRDNEKAEGKQKLRWRGGYGDNEIGRVCVCVSVSADSSFTTLNRSPAGRGRK